MRERAGLACAWTAVVLFLVAAVIVLSGGLTLRLDGHVLLLRNPARPAFAAVAAAAVAWGLLRTGGARARLRRWFPDAARVAQVVAVVASAAAFVVATAWNTRAAGGSDSSCYVLQAEAFAHGEARLWHPLAGVIPDGTPAMFAPTGFIPSPDRSGAAVPICAPGLALAMAAVSRVAGGGAVFLVVPVSAAIAVWLTFAFGRRAASDAAGSAAAVLLACSPVFLYQAVQPMSDVPATALWLGTLVAAARDDVRGQIVGGTCASLTVLTRPNLAIAVLPLLALLRGRAAWMRWGLAALPGAIAFACLNQVRYGSPVATGYGDTGVLFSWAHVTANLARYPRWLLETESPVVLLALAGPWIGSADRARARLATAALASSGLIVTTYLAYTVFDDWWYLRFLLPAVPVLLVYGVGALLRIVPPGMRGLAPPAICLVLGSWYVHIATTRHVFELRAFESRYVLTGRFAARDLPEGAVVIAGTQTGSVRYYGGRPTLAWDGVPMDHLDALAAELRATGHPVVIVLEDAESPAFRQRFRTQRLGRLDWAPIAKTPAPGVRVYRVP